MVDADASGSTQLTTFDPTTDQLHLAVALDGTGWHPASWRAPDARPADLFSAGYWADLAAEAERGLLDLLTIEDGLTLQSERYGKPDGRTDRVRGRLDAVLIAARLAPVTSHIGLVPAATVTHTEPFHVSKAIATLDHVSTGRAGVRVQVSARAHEAALFGRRDGLAPSLDPRDLADPDVERVYGELFDEAEAYVEAVRRLWDSWEDDAEIRDAATGRFIDRDRLHYVDVDTPWFSVKGPSITPRPPQGQPLVAALAHRSLPYRLLGRSADVGFITPHQASEIAPIVAEVRSAESEVARPAGSVRLFADLVVHLDATAERAQARLAQLDELAGQAFRSDAAVFAGTAEDLAALLVDWHGHGLTGFRLRPGSIPHDLEGITRQLVPALQRLGAFPSEYRHRTLRARFGLERPVSRYTVSR